MRDRWDLPQHTSPATAALGDNSPTATGSVANFPKAARRPSDPGLDTTRSPSDAARRKSARRLSCIFIARDCDRCLLCLSRKSRLFRSGLRLKGNLKAIYVNLRVPSICFVLYTSNLRMFYGSPREVGVPLELRHNACRLLLPRHPERTLQTGGRVIEIVASGVIADVVADYRARAESAERVVRLRRVHANRRPQW